ncbi:MAG: phosphoenolpyruvate kinase [Acidobacteria bacterium]|nr:phosphoenolpyruvate kinase [Acidobacteriota bacterium]
MSRFSEHYPGETGLRQPVHVVYGGAHLFRSDTSLKLGRLATQTFRTYAPDAATFAGLLGLRDELSATIYQRAGDKLEREAIEDLRIDFEDGYGIRLDGEEDGHAVSAAIELAKGMVENTLPPFIGFRIKAFSEEMVERSIRTLDLFLTTLIEATGGELPKNFVVTLPKVVVAEQVTALADILDEIETKLGLDVGTIKFEIMVETTQAIIGSDGRSALPAMHDAARGRLRGAHFGAYDYTAACGITSAYQEMRHQACDFARNAMEVALGGTGIWLSDGATNVMPIGPHRGDELSAEQRSENIAVVNRAWRLHYDHCRSSLANGFYQGWDLHPAQLATRYAATYAFFLEGIEDASKRLTSFLDAAARATLVGDVFDDAATGQGLLSFFLRAVNCGAITEAEATTRTGLTPEELRSASFATILNNRK